MQMPSIGLDCLYGKCWEKRCANVNLAGKQNRKAMRADVPSYVMDYHTPIACLDHV